MSQPLKIAIRKPHKLQKTIYDDPARFKVVISGRRFGKPLALDTKVLLAGKKPKLVNLDELEVGDYVYAASGLPTRVTFVSDVFYNQECYEIDFSTGESIVASSDHKWVLSDGSYKTTLELFNSKKRQYLLDIKPLVFETTSDISQNIPSYIMGYHIGDGTVGTNRITLGDKDSEVVKSVFKSHGYTLKKLSSKYAYKISELPYRSFCNYTKVNQFKYKFIPDEYIFTTVENRLELIRGLVDSDGTADSHGRIELVTNKSVLATQYKSILNSLGIRHFDYSSSRDSSIHRIYFRTDEQIFNIPRKQSRVKPSKYQVYVKSVTPVKPVPTKCIAVEDTSHTFLVGETLLPTHNTELGKIFIATTIFKSPRAATAWFSPTHDMYKNVMRYFLEEFSEVIEYKNLQERYFQFVNGSTLKFWSAEKIDRIRGQAYDFVVLDEAAYYKEGEKLWQASIRPTLSDRRGRAAFLTTPAGMNWVYDIYKLGLDPDNTEFKSWQYSSADSPHFDPTEYEIAKLSMPYRIFRQEYDAVFLLNESEVFKNITEVCSESWVEAPEEDHNYVMGVDFGRKNDFTIAMVFDTTKRRFVNMLQINKVSYNTITDEIKAFYEFWKPTTVYAESNSAGDVLIEQLRSKGLRLQEFYTTNTSKAHIIQQLSLGFEKLDFKAMIDPELIRQLQAFTIDITSSGKTRYGASYGHHDDMVIAMALAYHAFIERDGFFSTLIPKFS